VSSAAEWLALIHAIGDLPDGTPTAALATLVRTRGPTFRHAGARMLVHEDGRVVCELSGGCPQRDIVERARAVIRDGKPLRVAYNAESGLDVLMEMGCGGELEILIEPIERAEAMAWLAPLEARLRERRPVVLATWFARDGTTMASRHALSDGAKVDAPVCEVLRTALARPRPERATTIVVADAGGRDEVLIEPVQPQHALVAIGSNATAHALLRFVHALGWQATLVDGDPRRLGVPDLPAGVTACCADPGGLRRSVAFDAYTSVVAMTHNIAQDAAYLRALEGIPLAYVGALSSRGRALQLSSGLEAPGWMLHAPSGLDIGANTPEEIALAIAAEILAVQRARAGGPLHAGADATQA
jgi:xanthine/CO dehydrogenase XdhC/CoxF family maturation factor